MKQQLLEELLEPLQCYSLPHLSPQSLAALHGACRALSRLLQMANVQSLEPNTAHLLPDGLFKHAKCGEDVHQMLRQAYCVGYQLAVEA